MRGRRNTSPAEGDVPKLVRYAAPSGPIATPAGNAGCKTQPLQILEALLARPGELVTREQLIARLWPKGIVDFDTALNSAVHRLRVALGDHPESPRYIETIPRRGYRFIGQVGIPEAASTGTVERAVQTQRRWVAATTALPLVLLAVGVVLALRLDGGRAPPAMTTPTASAEAHERFLRAQHFFQRRASGDDELARKYFEEALEIDPGFARAWAGLAGAYWIDTIEGRMPPEEGLAKLRAAAERALALEPRLAEAHLRLANYWWVTGDGYAGDEHLRMALEFEPDNSLVLGFSASNALGRGHFDEAIALQRRAVHADALSALSRYNLAATLYLAGRLPEAKRELMELQELRPLPGKSSELLCLVLILEGRFSEALELATEWPDDLLRHHCLALALHGSGRRADSDAALRRLVDASQGDDRFLVAEVLAYRGEIDAAFDWLQATMSEIETAPWLQGGRRWPWHMQYSPFLQPLHSDSRWNAWRESLALSRHSE